MFKKIETVVSTILIAVFFSCGNVPVNEKIQEEENVISSQFAVRQVNIKHTKQDTTKGIKQVEFLDGRVEISIPRTFTRVSEDVLIKDYPNIKQRPTLAYAEQNVQ